MCAGRPCWRETGSGFRYDDPELTPDGLRQVVLREGLAAGKAKIFVKGKGANLPMPSLPLAQPVLVQLHNSDGLCWEATYSAPALKNQTDQFRDKAD